MLLQKTIKTCLGLSMIFILSCKSGCVCNSSAPATQVDKEAIIVLQDDANNTNPCERYTLALPGTGKFKAEILVRGVINSNNGSILYNSFSSPTLQNDVDYTNNQNSLKVQIPSSGSYEVKIKIIYEESINPNTPYCSPSNCCLKCPEKNLPIYEGSVIESTYKPNIFIPMKQVDCTCCD